MTTPLDVHEQMKQQWFVPTRTLLLLFSMTNFDAVLKKNDKPDQGPDKPVFAELPAAETDCIDLKKCMEEFNIKDEHDVFILENVTEKVVLGTLTEIRNRLKQGRKEKPPTNYLVISLFAGHGILKDGAQQLILNEY